MIPAVFLMIANTFLQRHTEFREAEQCTESLLYTFCPKESSSFERKVGLLFMVCICPLSHAISHHFQTLYRRFIMMHSAHLSVRVVCLSRRLPNKGVLSYIIPCQHRHWKRDYLQICGVQLWYMQLVMDCASQSSTLCPWDWTISLAC